MKHNWMALLVTGAGLSSVMFGQHNPNRNYGPSEDRGYSNYDSDYDRQGYRAPAPPPMPRYAYQRPPMPRPGYFWVDGYWSFFGGRYSWVGGYWMRPPHAGASWVRPRYAGGRYYQGYWGGVRPHMAPNQRYRGGR